MTEQKKIAVYTVWSIIISTYTVVNDMGLGDLRIRLGDIVELFNDNKLKAISDPVRYGAKQEEAVAKALLGPN